MATLVMELKPRSVPVVPKDTAWGGRQMSGPRIEQLLSKFAAKHLNVPLSQPGAVRPIDWTRGGLLEDFSADRVRHMQGYLGPKDGALLVFLGGTVEQAGDTLQINSQYTIESTDVDPKASVPVIGPDRQEIIKQALRAAVGHLILEDLKKDVKISCVWGPRCLALEISLPV